jgi:hypothetical protein
LLEFATVIELSDKVMTELSPRCTEYKEQVAFSDLTDQECKAFVKTLEKLWSRFRCDDESLWCRSRIQEGSR